MIPLLALALGFATGLRSMTGLAAVAWGARLGWLSLKGTGLAFFASPWAVVVLTLAALGEYVGDKLPKTPARTALGPFGFRIVAGGLCGAALTIGTGHPAPLGAVCGVVGAVAGTLGGYRYRMAMPRRFGMSDFPFAIVEDLVAIALAGFVVAYA